MTLRLRGHAYAHSVKKQCAGDAGVNTGLHVCFHLYDGFAAYFGSVPIAEAEMADRSRGEISQGIQRG